MKKNMRKLILKNAANNGNVEVTRTLLKAGANPNASDKVDRT